MAIATTRRHRPIDNDADLDPDVAAKLPAGFSDPRHACYIPPELRRVFAEFDPELVEKTRWQMRNVLGTMIRTGPTGKIFKIEPHLDADDLTVGVTWRLIDLARRRVHSDRSQADRAAHDAHHYRCEICNEVRTPGLLGRHTTRRPLANGRTVHACADCAAVADQLAVAELAAQTIDGRSRAELAAALLERANQ